MSSKQITQLVKELSFEKKFILFGSVLLVLSAFMPWFEDMDAFRRGVTYLGVSGPIYLAGYMVLAVGVLNIVKLVVEFRGGKIPFLNMGMSDFGLYSSAGAFFILLFANSVFFHPDFGINIPLKQTQFGMFTAFAGVTLVTFGAFLARRKAVGAKNRVVGGAVISEEEADFADSDVADAEGGADGLVHELGKVSLASLEETVNEATNLRAVPSMETSVKTLQKELGGQNLQAKGLGGLRKSVDKPLSDGLKKLPEEPEIHSSGAVASSAPSVTHGGAKVEPVPYSGGPEMLKKLRERSVRPVEGQKTPAMSGQIRTSGVASNAVSSAGTSSEATSKGPYSRPAGAYGGGGQIDPSRVFSGGNSTEESSLPISRHKNDGEFTRTSRSPRVAGAVSGTGSPAPQPFRTDL